MGVIPRDHRIAERKPVGRRRTMSTRTTPSKLKKTFSGSALYPAGY